MLRFTEAQQAFLLANRRQFNQRQSALAQLHNGAMMIGNAQTLPKDVWGEWDREAVEIQREVLVVFNDLAAAVSQPMPIGKLVHYFQTVSDSGSVNVSLDGRGKGRTDQPVIDYYGTPLPIIDSPFVYGWRQVEAARTEGFQLDSAGRANSMYKIAERLENIALNGDSTIVVGGAPLYGLRNHPRRNTRTTGVTLNGATGDQWLIEIRGLLRELHDANFKVPATIYLNWDDWFYASNTDFKANGDKTIAQRVREIEGVREVVPADKVPVNEMLAVVKNRRTIQVLNGMPMSTRAQFRANPEDDYEFVTMAAAAVEIKFDSAFQCGVAHSAP